LRIWSPRLKDPSESLHRLIDVGGRLDVTEVYLDWKPFPKNGWRWRTKFGAFYPPVSLENRAAGWASGYSLSSSAINTWLGEEFRTIGAEVTATWLGSQHNGSGDLSLIGGSTNSTMTRDCCCRFAAGRSTTDRRRSSGGCISSRSFSRRHRPLLNSGRASNFFTRSTTGWVTTRASNGSARIS
jgi:hypothetical protein